MAARVYLCVGVSVTLLVIPRDKISFAGCNLVMVVSRDSCVKLNGTRRKLGSVVTREWRRVREKGTVSSGFLNQSSQSFNFVLQNAIESSLSDQDKKIKAPLAYFQFKTTLN